MGYQDSFEFYINLSRKELQILCKSHNLPANKSVVQLAKSLSSFFKKKNALAKSLTEKQSKRAVSSPEETSDHGLEDLGASERRATSSGSDSDKVNSAVKEVVDAQPDSQTGNKLETNNTAGSQKLEEAHEASPESVYPHPVKSGDARLISSIAEPGGVGKKPLVALEQEQPEVSPPGISAQETQIVSPPVPSAQQKNVQSSKGLVASDDTLRKPASPFQFFVTSEEGINLYVDLNSSLSDWIDSMKDEVRICQKGSYHSSRNISNHVRGLQDVDNRLKIPSSGIGMNLQSDGIERNAECTNSSLTSVASENCHSEASAPDPIAVTSRASVLAQSNIPAQISGGHKGNQTVSSSCMDVSNKMEKNKASVFGVPSESIGNNCMSTRDKIKNSTNSHHPKIATVESSVAVSAVENSEKNNPAMTDKNENNDGRSISRQLDGQLLQDCPETVAQPDVATTNYFVKRQSCSNPGDSVTKDPMLAVHNEAAIHDEAREKERTGSEKNSKRSHNSEFPGALPSKRQHVHSENKSGAMMNLRSTKAWAKESISSPVSVPRRSTRLVSK